MANNNWRSKVNAMMTDQNYAAKAASVIGDTRSKNLKLMNKSAEDYPALSVGQQTKQPLDLARVPEMQQEQAARATMGSNDEDYSGVVDLATKLYDEERTKRGQQALQNMQQPANAFASPMATAINRAAETNKAADISKTYEAVISNPSLQQAVRLNANKALVKALEANPSMTQEEQQKLYNNTIDKQLQKMGEGIDKYLRGKNELKGGGEYVLRSAIQNSIIGKAMQTAIQSASGSEGESAYQQQALADYDANKAKWWEQGLGIAGGLVLDAPLMQGIGSAANATMGRATMWGLGKAGGKALQASTVGRIATGAAVSSGTLGGYNATSALANQLMEGRFDVGEIAASAGHGFMLGALTGGMSPWLRGVSAGMGKVGKVATMTSGLTAEAGIFTASELSEMDNPYDLETIAQVFGKNVAVIGGLKISNLPKTVKEYKQWYTEGKQSNFTDADYKTMADFAKANGYAADDAFTMSADGAYSRSVADRVTGNRTLLTMTKLQGGKEQNLAIEMYNDPNVPLSLKTKIAAKMNLPAPPPVLPNGVRVGGNKAITYYTMPNGQQQVIDIKEFDRPRKARAFANEFSRTTARRNDLLQSEASVNVMMSQPMVVARLNEQAKRNGTTLADEKARMDGILQRAADGTITQEDIAYYRSIVEDDVTTTESLKKDIKDKFGVEIDEVLNKEGNFTAAEDEALTAYGNALRGIIERGNPTTERTATAAMAGIEDYVALNNLGIEQTSAILSNPEQRAAIEQQTRSHYAAWLKFFDGKMGEDALAQKLGLDLNNTSDLQTFITEQTYFKAKAADRIAYNTAEAAKQLLEQGNGGVRFLDDGRVKLKGVPFAVEVDESIVARYEAAKQGNGEPMQRIVNDALKDIIKQSETPAESREPMAEETPIVEEPMTEAEAVTQQMVDARLAEIDTDLQGIDADGVQRMTINGKPAAIIKGRIVADENGQVDKTKSSAEVAYMLLDENGRPMLNEQGKPIIEVGVKPSNVHVEDIEQWRSVDDYKASEEQRIRDNNRITDEAMRQVDEQTADENQVPTEPKTADDLLAMCDGDKALALDVATDELAKAMQAKGKGATPAETIEINKRIRMYQQMVDRLSATEQPESASLPEVEQTEIKAEPQVTEDMEFVYQQGLDENHDGMEPMKMTDGRYKWVGLQRGELTATMGERDVELLDNLAKKLGVAVIPINVKDRAVNGYYKDGNIYVNTNRGAEWTMRWVAGHEMLHDVAKKSPEAYDAYKQAVLDMWGSDYIESQVKQIIEDYAKSGKTIDREQALTELVNDFGGDLFSSRDGLKILDGILKDQSSKGNTGFIDTIKKWWENIKEFFGVSPYANEVEKKLADAYKEAIANAEEFRKNQEMDKGVSSVTDAARVEGAAIDFSIKTEPQVAQRLREYAETKDGKKHGWDKETIEGIINETEDLIDAIHNSLQGNQRYDAWADKNPTMRVDWRDGELKQTVTWSRGNVEYKYDMSADLLCINNDALEDVLASPAMVRIIRAMDALSKNGFTSDDYLRIYQVLRDKGFVVPCAGCFDAAARFKMLPSVAKNFADLVNEVVDERNADPKAFDAKVKAMAKGKTTIEGLPTSAATKQAAIRIGVAGDKLTEHITSEQLMSAQGQTDMLANLGGIFRAWQRTGAGRPKDKLLPEPYVGDINSTTTTIIGKYGDKTPSYRDIYVNQGTGLRRNSHSEFRPLLAIDEIQFMRDAFAKGLTVFKYMKELDDVRLFGNMGVKFNMSFFPAFVKDGVAAGLDANGNYIASEESVGSREFAYMGEDGRTHYDGMRGWQEAQKYTNENVSLSSVVFSVPHLIKALTDVPTPSDKSGMWGSLIPFHSSGATSAHLALQGLGRARANGVGHPFSEAMYDYNKGVTNFEAVQNDRFGEGWVIIEGKKAGTAIENGHKLEFANGTHMYNAKLGVHLFNDGYIFDKDIKKKDNYGNGKVNTKNVKNYMTKFYIDYNDKTRELGGDYAYKDAADYYLRELPKIGLIPRFSFEVPESIYLEMCKAANVDPKHPKLGWKGEGNAWNPIDAESYYSLFCDYGMTDPKTGKWSPHKPIGNVDENGNRVFRLPDNAVQIVKDAVDKYSARRDKEESRINDVYEEFLKRSVKDGRLSEAEAQSLLSEISTDPDGSGKPIDDEFSIKADKQLEKKSLVGVHNLTEDNLRYALNLGGLANPSTAVIDKNIMGLEGFGDISLIMPKSLVAKSTGKNAGTFAGDAYTPRFPKGDVVKYITKEGEKAIRADYPGDDKFSKDFREAWQSYGNEYGGITPTLYYMYKLENGGAKIVKAEAPKIKSKEHQRMIDKFGNKEWYELNDAEKRELVDYRKSEMIESLKGADKNMVDKVVNDFINSADPEDLAYKKLRMLKMDYKEQQKAGEIDYMATYRNAQDDVALAGEQAKFNKWLADKSKRYGIEDRIFRGYTASGNRKYAPMTLANISKVMKEQGRAGAETFMTKSAYSLRGKMLPVYKTLEQIKKNKSKLADTETYEKFRKEIGDEYNELILDISELPNVKYDDTHYILEDALLKGFDYAEKQAGIQISKAVRERISAFGNLLKEAPVKYFETKFERPVMFDEFVAAVVPKNINPELRKALADKGLAIEEYERGSEESRLEAVRRASDRDDVQFSVKGKRADESVLDYAKRMSEETGKKNLLNGGSYFSGGGLLEEGLKGIVNPAIAVEFNQKVAGVYRNNFGEHIVTADVRNVDPASLVKNIDGPVAYFHASPVCKNFSRAKQSAEELPLDKATAQSTAEFISKVRPKIATIENVKGYRDSESMKIILDELKKQGYNYDVDVYNAADYGAYTSRERLIVRAVRDWSLPAKPMVMLADDRPSGWLEAVADIIDTLPEKKGGVAKWMDERLMAMGIDYRNIDKPLYVFGSGYSKDRIGYAFADELVPTLRTKGGDVIVMPDGRVLKATPRVLARISGMSDEYEMPKTDDLAHTIVGNGIPVQLTKAVMGSLIENVKSDLDAGNTEYSIIGKRGAANLDKRDETSIRVDNMVTAEEMEKAGKDAKTIRMATGWERGADGKWRYEVDDLSMLPAEQWIGKRGKKLSDIVENAEELFAAYPELTNVKIKEGNGKTYGGSYSDGTITLDTYLAKLWMKRLPGSLPRANKFMNETLIHEIQHYIQEKEGFAQGGNEGMILNKDAISEIDALISNSNKLAVQYNDMIAKGVYEGREAIKDKIISLRAEANAIKKKNSLGTEGYRSLAGEVEARNAEFRSNMTDKERANTMLADTEDVAREDQIFLPDDLSKNAKGDYSIKQPKDVEYEAKEQWRKDNAGAIASSFFADRRADKAAEVERLKKKISELKADNTKAVSEDKAKVREIADEMHAYIKKNIPTENQGDMTRQQFESVLKQLETAVTKQELEKPMQMVEYIGANVARRALTRQMRDFVKNGFKALTPKGLAKPKTVDGVTSRVLGLVKTLYQSMNKNAFGSDLYKLQKQVREEKAKLEQFNADNGGKYQDVVDKVNEILAKTGVDRYEELYKYFDEKQAAGDVDGDVLGYIGRMLPLLDSIELTKDQQKQVKANSAITTKEDLDQLRTSLEEKRDKGILSEEDKAVLDNMPLYEAMLNLHQQQLNIDGPGASSLAMQMKAKVGEIKEYGKKLDELDNKNSKTAIRYKTRIKEANNELQELFAARIVDQKAVNANVGELLNNLKEIRDTGKSKLQEWSKAKQERATRLVKMANESFGKDAKGYWSEVDKRGKLKKDFINWANNLRLSVLMSPAMSFEYMLGVMDPRYYTNNSPIYKQFIKSSEGLIKANDNFFEGTESYNMAVNEAVERFINRNAMTNLKEYFRRGDRFATAIIPFEVKVNRNGVDEYIPKEEMMTRGQAAKIYAWSRMADGMAKLKAHGVTDNTLTKVKEFIGEDYMNFIDWVEDEFFPRLRRERYNPVYKQMYGISMAENDHYFPFLIYQKDVRTEQELEVSNNDTLGGGVVGNLVERKRNNARLDFTAESPDIFDMITDYGKKMEEWAAYAQVREDLKKVVNDKQFKQHCDELGTHYYKYFLEAAQVASRLYNPQPSVPTVQKLGAKVQKTFASAAISLRVSTALKQLLSAPAFMVYSLDPAFQHELIKTAQPIDVESAIKGLMKLAEGDMSEAKKLLLSENWVGHYNWCVENLPSFRERVTLKGAGNPILEEKGFFKLADDIQSVGMLPNRLVDAFTCSVGAKAIYEYAYKKYRKNYSEKIAHNMAVTDAEIAFNSSQQSSNPVFLAPIQVSKEFWLRGLMNYKNSPIGYYRNAMKASIDMYRAAKVIFGQPKFTINGEKVGFESDGKNPYAMAAESGARASMFWVFLNLVWNFGTVGVAGLSHTMLNGFKNDDGNMLYTDEEIKKAMGGDMRVAVFNAATQGIPWVSGFFSAAQTGQDYTPSILFSEMNNYIEQINKDGFMSMATAAAVTDLLLKNAAGVDPEVWGQIYRGAQGIMEDRPMRTEDFMNLIASPRSAISGVTKQRVGEYDRLRDYVNDRIESNRQLGVDERMTFGKKLTGMRELSKKSLGMYVDEYLADKIPGYREFANKPTEMEKEEEVANSNTLNAASSLYETIVRKEEEKEEKKDKIKDRSTKRKIKVLTKVANVIHKLCEVNDFETAERVANEMERRVKRGYNPDGKTIEEKLKNVDVWDSTGTTEQRSADGFSTAFDRARKGGFDSYLRRGKD